jgi:hypothetical protein
LRAVLRYQLLMSSGQPKITAEAEEGRRKRHAPLQRPANHIHSPSKKPAARQFQARQQCRTHRATPPL